MVRNVRVLSFSFSLDDVPNSLMHAEDKDFHALVQKKRQGGFFDGVKEGTAGQMPLGTLPFPPLPSYLNPFYLRRKQSMFPFICRICSKCHGLLHRWVIRRVRDCPESVKSFPLRCRESGNIYLSTLARLRSTPGHHPMSIL